MSKTKATAVVEMKETDISVRSPEVIAAEIRSIDQQARQYVLQSAIEIGRRLTEVKELVPHGEWGNWLKTNVNYSQSSANNFMRVAEEYGNSQALANLSYSQAVALLSVPAEEREAFVEENNAADMSTRELQAAIKEKQELEKRLQEEQERARLAEEQAEAAKTAREFVSKSLDEVQKEKRELDQRLSQLQEELDKAKTAKDDKAAAKLKTELRKAEKAASAAEDKLAQLEEALKQKDAELEKIVADRLKQQEQELAELAKKEKDALQEQMAKLEQQLQRSNNEAFLKAKLQLQQIINQGDSLVKAIAEVKDEEEQAKLKTATVKVIDQLRGLF